MQKHFLGYFSVAVFLNLNLVLFNPECLALLYCICIANPLTECEFHLRAMCQYHCVDVFFSCLDNKISLVKKISTELL